MLHTLAEAHAALAALAAPGVRFEMEEVVVRGVSSRVWKNAPPSLPRLFTAARGHGERWMTIYEDERVSYEASCRAAAALAYRLAGLGVGRGDRVAIAMRNLPEWPIAFFAATALGAIAVPLRAWWTRDELAQGPADSAARVVIADAERYQRLASYPAVLPVLEHVRVFRTSARCTVGRRAGG